MTDPPARATLRWIGGPTVELTIGGFRLLTDPMLAEGPQAFIMHGHPSTGAESAAIARLAPLPALDLLNLDAVLISHLHSDHFDALARQRLPRRTRLIAPLSEAAGLVAGGFHDVEGLDWWQVLDLERESERLVLTAVPTEHSHDPAVNHDLGPGNGYLLEYSSEKQSLHIYWTGDTLWFPGMQQIQQLAGPLDLLIPHLGAVGQDGPWGLMTLDAGEAARVIALFDPRVIIPVHHHTFAHYVEPVSALAELLAAQAPGQLLVLAEGEEAVFPLEG